MKINEQKYYEEIKNWDFSTFNIISEKLTNWDLYSILRKITNKKRSILLIKLIFTDLITKTFTSVKYIMNE